MNLFIIIKMLNEYILAGKNLEFKVVLITVFYIIIILRKNKFEY